MGRLDSFYKWYVMIGGAASSIAYAPMTEFLKDDVVKVSSFKCRSKEVKELYNHKFN